MNTHFIKRTLILLALSLGILIVSVLAINRYISHSAEDRIFSSTETIPYHRVGLLLGVGKYTQSGGVNLYYKSRLQATIDLYQANKITEILISGDNGHIKHNEPVTFLNDLEAAGIPTAAIHLDYAGFRTRDSIIRAREIFGLEDFTIISQEFHNERAIYIATHENLDVVAYNAPAITGEYSWRTELREYFARVLAVYDVIFNTPPKFSGEPIKI